MYDQDDVSDEFWAGERTTRLERISARVRPEGRRPVTRRPRSERPHNDTQQIPVVSNVTKNARSVASKIDPLMRRIGVLSLVLVLGVPVAFALRGGDGGFASQLQPEPQDTTLAVGSAPTPSPGPSPAPESAPRGSSDTPKPAAPRANIVVPVANSVDQPTVCPKAYTVASGDYWISIADRAGVTMRALLDVNNATIKTVLLPGRTICLPSDAKTPAPITTTVATVAAAPPTAAPAPAVTKVQTPAVVTCTKKYTVAAGDGWIAIAKRVGVSLGDLLAANHATTATVLVPGRTVCLPANAVLPAPTVVTTTTVKAPTAAPRRVYTRAEVEAIVREVWPNDLEETALAVVQKESDFNPYSANYCCYGLFQIYFNAHKSWLSSIGITSASQLFDPRVNAIAALNVYRRSNGWSPWGL